MRTSVWRILASILLLSLLPLDGQSAEYLSEDGGEWHSSSTWRSGKVPAGDDDRVRIYATAPLTLAKGSVSAYSYYFYSKAKAPDLKIAPFAHLSVLKRLTNRRTPSTPVNIDVQGSLTVQGGASLYGQATLTVRGGYVFGLGRTWHMASHGDKKPEIHIREGGMLAVRRIYLKGDTTIRIDQGEARFNGIDFGGDARIIIRKGTLAVGDIGAAGQKQITLLTGGQLALKGRVNKSNLQQLYPDLRLYDKNGIRNVESLSFSEGTGALAKFTCIGLSAGDAEKADNPGK